MTPSEEQAERERIAFALDILLSITAINLQRAEPPAARTLSQRLGERQRTIDPGWLELWRWDAVA
jgi:hypothetical protein